MCLVIHSYKTILNCPFARLNNCNIRPQLINKKKIIRFVVDQFIGSTFYAEHLPWFGLHAADPEKKQSPPHSIAPRKKTLIPG